MCGRYGLYDTDKFDERFKTARPTPTIEPNYNAAPGQNMPVVVGKDGARSVRNMRWGLVPPWAKDDKVGYKMINARAETVFEKPAWRGAIRHRRALIPASGFYEWKTLEDKSAKQPYYIHPTDQSLFAFAGIYEIWNDPKGKILSTYSIITTEPNEQMKSIHDRMPVILRPEHEQIWLDPQIEDREVLQELLRPYKDNTLEIFKVSTDVNSVLNNDKHLVQPQDPRLVL